MHQFAKGVCMGTLGNPRIDVVISEIDFIYAEGAG